MVQPILLSSHREITAFAERVADICHRRLCERPHAPVPLEHIMDQTQESRSRVEAAVERLRREGRLHLGHYAMRWRPHIAIDAVDRIDDLSMDHSTGRA
jgi:hypothetical protein